MDPFHQGQLLNEHVSADPLDPWDIFEPSNISLTVPSDIFFEDLDVAADLSCHMVPVLDQHNNDSLEVSPAEQTLSQVPNTKDLPQESLQCERGEIFHESRTILSALPTAEEPVGVYNSDCSWNTADDDDFEDYYLRLKSSLDQLCRNDGPGYVLTSALPSKKRRQIHTLAKLMGLSHMSIHSSGSTRRLLVSKYKLSKDVLAPSIDRIWNPKTIPFGAAELDPRIIAVSSQPLVTEQSLLLLLASKSLPSPLEVSESLVPNIKPSETLLSARFQTATDAAEVLTALTDLKDQICSLLGNPNFSYVLHTHSDDTGGGSQHALGPQDITACHMGLNSRNSSSTGLERQSRDLDTGYWSSSSRMSMSSNHLNLPSFTESSPVSLHRSSSLGSGFACSQYASDASMESASFPAASYSAPSAEGSRSHRRRLPKNKDHYACRAQDCNKTFDRAGERKKHERIHQPPETWPHCCPGCNKRFLERKDLVRHSMSHSGDDAYNQPWACASCNLCFMRIDHLLRHEDNRHARTRRNIRCNHCADEKTFPRNDMLTRHIRVVHPEVNVSMDGV